MLRLVSDGTNDTELDILRRVSTPAEQARPENHCLPMIDERHCDGFTFAVLPCVSKCGVLKPWFRNLDEALDFAEQLLEVSADARPRARFNIDVGAGLHISPLAGNSTSSQSLIASQFFC